MLPIAHGIGKTSALPDIPDTPTGLSLTESPAYKFNASWNSSVGATGYKIRYRLDGGAWFEIDRGANTSYSSPFVQPECTVVEAEVLAYNSGGESAWSGTAFVNITCP